MIMPLEDALITLVIPVEEAMKDSLSMHSKLKHVVENDLNRLATHLDHCMYAGSRGVRNPRLRSIFGVNTEVNP